MTLSIEFQVPLEKKPNADVSRGDPHGTGLGIDVPFENPLCNPAANTIMESGTRNPSITKAVFPFAGVMLPTIPRMPLIRMKALKAKSNHRFIGISVANPMNEIASQYGNIETSVDIVITMIGLEKLTSTIVVLSL